MCPPGLFDRPAEAPRSAHHSPEPAYSPRCLLSLQSRRRLGDRKPYRLVDPHVGVSVSHRRDGYCRLHWLRESCERSRPPFCISVAGWFGLSLDEQCHVCVEEGLSASVIPIAAVRFRPARDELSAKAVARALKRATASPAAGRDDTNCLRETRPWQSSPLIRLMLLPSQSTWRSS